MEGKGQLRSDLEALRMDRAEQASPPPRRGRARRSRRPVWIAAGALALGIAVWLLLGGRARPVTLARVSAGDPAAAADVPVLSAAGYIVPADKIVEIGSRVPGRVARFLVEEGDRVTAGQALVELDARPYQHALDEAEARLAGARARVALARQELSRGRNLKEREYLSPEELDKRTNEEQGASAALAEAEAAVERAKLDLDDTVLRAPTAGIVLAKLKDAGEIAVPGGFAGSGDLVRLANMQDVRAEVDVNESDLGRIRMGQRAEVTPDAFPDLRLAAAVVKLDPQVDRQKGTLKIEVKLAAPDPRLLPDMSARVSFLGDATASGQTGPVVQLPSAAVRRGVDGRTYVWTVADGRAHKVFVRTAGLVGEDVRVVDGLTGGEEVVVGDPPEDDGERVAPRP
ncbi:MAG TPA: efflux RND transporter periplasmic adaptor subunit [Myxococcota bacterium]|jgi:RND family efflux transporter MFP subunit|nr:efflux RND transporter periplasmic adaptor subunit [Myxococcota bacterium]